jgi:metallophosphoesterase (TIGR00282 family)
MLRNLLPELREQYLPDFVIANGENAAAGYGITRSTAAELFDSGVDCLTMGNHVWAQKEAYTLLEQDNRILRPANYPHGVPGIGFEVYHTPGAGAIGVVNLLGRVFMDAVDCPFRAGMQAAERLGKQCDALIVDIHAEATSEKCALARYLDGKVTAVLGTHTHVQTADETILAGGTAFLSDVGMTGASDGVIGVKADVVINRFLTALPARFEVPVSGPSQLNAVVIQTGADGRKATRIERIRILTDGAAEVS